MILILDQRFKNHVRTPTPGQSTPSNPSSQSTSRGQVSGQPRGQQQRGLTKDKIKLIRDRNPDVCFFFNSTKGCTRKLLDSGQCDEHGKIRNHVCNFVFPDERMCKQPLPHKINDHFSK